jgi:hypothetical protein
LLRWGWKEQPPHSHPRWVSGFLFLSAIGIKDRGILSPAGPKLSQFLALSPLWKLLSSHSQFNINIILRHFMVHYYILLS